MKKAPEKTYAFEINGKKYYARVSAMNGKPCNGSVLSDYVAHQKQITQNIADHLLQMERNHSERLQEGYDTMVRVLHQERKDVFLMKADHSNSSKIIEVYKKENADLRKTEQKYFDLQKDHFKLDEELKREREVSKSMRNAALIGVCASVFIAILTIVFLAFYV